MASDKSIFGLRFSSNPEISPTRAELKIFLDVTTKTGSRVPHRIDMARYHELIESLSAFDGLQKSDAGPGLQEKMYYTVLRNSRFVTPALELAVEQFKYHLHSLKMLDLRKPAAFIKVAETEIGRIPPKKRTAAETAKAERLRVMIDERKQLIATLTKRRTALAAELGHIARYIRDNLVKIARRCEASIVMLAELQTSQKDEKVWVDDVRGKLREQLKDSLHQSKLSRQDLDAAKEDLAVLSREISALLREDVYAMARLYEAIHDHVKKHARSIVELLEETADSGKGSIEEEQALFAKIERTLVSLISDGTFDLTRTARVSEAAHQQLLQSSRRDSLQTIFALLEKERRAPRERRSGEDRRIYKGPLPPSGERRNGKDRRSGKNRRARESER